jgi:hypothetical protein
MAKALSIGSLEFKTQSKALEHFKKILHAYADGDRVDDLNHHSDLMGLLGRYDPIPEAVGEPLKGRNQIDYFERRLNTGTGWSSSGFWVVRKDGSATDFSYIDAVKGKPKGASQDFYNACREAVALDLIQAKKNAFKEYGDVNGFVACELTGKLVAIDGAHLDHAWPFFSHLVSGFRAARGWSIQIPMGIVSEPADKQLKAVFIDQSIADAFREYHHSQAVLRILSKEANLQTASAARKPKVVRPVRVQ